jgi:Na+-translocating ferredoxin:NAD+ oxidoreductase subunit B
MSDELYKKLATFLDNLPGGFPPSESGVEIKILKKLFTEEQAELFMKMNPLPEPLGKIAERWGMNEQQAAEKVEAMSFEGLCYRERREQVTLYMPMQFVVGIYEFHLNSIDRELSELMEEYMPTLSTIFKDIKTKQLRVAPHAGTIDVKHTVAPYDQIKDLVKGKDKIAVAHCICRKETELLGHPCDHPTEVCMMFGYGADYFVENKMARYIDLAEALSILDLAEQKGLVLSPTNTEDIVNICMCCGCSCGVLRMLKEFDRPADHYDSSFQAVIDPDLCSACGTCETRCQIDAIIPGDQYAVDKARCIGCGLCVSTCPEDAIEMRPRKRPNEPPKNMPEMMMNIWKDRGKM